SGKGRSRNAGASTWSSGTSCARSRSTSSPRREGGAGPRSRGSASRVGRGRRMGRTDDVPKGLEAWFERDLTAAARAGDLSAAHEVEPVLKRLVEVLAGGRSPVLVGESGVGKTAILEELVRRAVRGEVEPL